MVPPEFRLMAGVRPDREIHVAALDPAATGQLVKMLLEHTDLSQPYGRISAVQYRAGAAHQVRRLRPAANADMVAQISVFSSYGEEYTHSRN